MTETGETITVKIRYQRKGKDFEAARYNCRWMGGEYDPISKTWAIPADRVADVERFVANGQLEVI